jgi:hypothetical protein
VHETVNALMLRRESEEGQIERRMRRAGGVLLLWLLLTVVDNVAS